MYTSGNQADVLFLLQEFCVGTDEGRKERTQNLIPHLQGTEAHSNLETLVEN